MKAIFIMLVAGPMSFCELRAQGNKPIPDPEYLNLLYFVTDSNSLLNLEKGEVEMVTKTKLGGIGGASISYVMDGAHSPVRVNGPKPVFIFRMENMMVTDPSVMIRLYKFESRSKTRESVLGKSGVMGKGSNNNNQQGIPILFKKKSDGVYLLEPEKPMEDGEYGLINMMVPAGMEGNRMKYTIFAFACKQ